MTTLHPRRSEVTGKDHLLGTLKLVLLRRTIRDRYHGDTSTRLRRANERERKGDGEREVGPKKEQLCTNDRRSPINKTTQHYNYLSLNSFHSLKVVRISIRSHGTYSITLNHWLVALMILGILFNSKD